MKLWTSSPRTKERRHLGLRVSASSVVLVGSAGAFALASCSSSVGPVPGAVMISIDTNLKAPEDVDAIGIEVQLAADGGTVYTDEVFDVSTGGDGGAVFPATFAVIRGTDQPVAIKVVGYKGGNAITVRDAITTLPPDRTAVLQMDIDWLDKNMVMATSSDSRDLPALPSTFSSTCHALQTSIAGSCESIAEVIADQELSDGGLPTFVQATAGSSQNSDVCFDVDTCFGGFDRPAASGSGDELDVLVAMASDGTCSFLAPTDTTNLNVGLRLAGGKDGWCNAGDTACVLPIASDPKSGWHLDGKGRVQLPTAICTDRTRYVAVVATTQASGVDASGRPVSCVIKSASVPACQEYAAVTDAGAVMTDAEDATFPDAAQMDSAATVDAGPDDLVHQYPAIGASTNTFVAFAADSQGVYLAQQEGQAFAIVPLDNSFVPSALGKIQFNTGGLVPFYLAASTPYLAAGNSQAGVTLYFLNGGAIGQDTFTTEACTSLDFSGDVGPRYFVAAGCGTNGTYKIAALDGTTSTPTDVDGGAEIGAGTFDRDAGTYLNGSSSGADYEIDRGMVGAGLGIANTKIAFYNQTLAGGQIRATNVMSVGGDTAVYILNYDNSVYGTRIYAAGLNAIASSAASSISFTSDFASDASTGMGTLATTGNTVLWLSNGQIYSGARTGQATIDAGTAQPHVVTGAGAITAMSIVNGYVYWMTTGNLYKQSVTGFLK